MRHHRLRRAALAILALGSVSRAWAAPVPWTGSLTIDFTQTGGTSATWPTLVAGTAIINGGSGVLTPITKVTLLSQSIQFSGFQTATTGIVPPTTVPGIPARVLGGYMGINSIVLTAGGTCQGTVTGFLNCPGGGLAGHGGVRSLYMGGLIGYQYLSLIIGGGGYVSNFANVYSAPPYYVNLISQAAGVGWTTGQVTASGLVFAPNATPTPIFYSLSAVSAGGVSGSTINLVSPLLIVDVATGSLPVVNPLVPAYGFEPGIARLMINLQGLTCGDGLIFSGEGCDDTNVAPGDGCDASCQIEAGYTCTGAPSVCDGICGDGLIVGSEGCDDTNVAPGDGCDASCQIEAGYTCTGAPSVCDGICGDGLIVGSETCDDDNVAAGDGCDATCQIEAGYACDGAPSDCFPAVAVNAVKLIVVDKGASGAKAVFVAKDAAITKGAATSTTTIGLTLDFDYDNGTDPASAGQFVAPVASANWLVNKSTVAKYVNKTAPTGGGTKVSVIKPGKLVKVVGKNLGDTPIDILNQSAVATGVANTAVCVDNGPDSNCFCSTFAACAWKSIAAGTGAKLVCKTGTGNAACEALP